MNAKNLLASSFAAVCFLTINSSHSEWYLGADVIPVPNWMDYESFSADVLIPSGVFDEAEPSMRFIGGYQATSWLALEVGYQDGMDVGIDNLFSGSRLWSSESSNLYADSSAFILSGVSEILVTDSVSLTMRGGVMNWDLDTSSLQFDEELDYSRNGTDLFYSLGASYAFTQNFGLRAEWERFEMNDEDIDFLSTELNYSF